MSTKYVFSLGPQYTVTLDANIGTVTVHDKQDYLIQLGQFKGEVHSYEAVYGSDYLRENILKLPDEKMLDLHRLMQNKVTEIEAEIKKVEKMFGPHPALVKERNFILLVGVVVEEIIEAKLPNMIETREVKHLQ